MTRMLPLSTAPVVRDEEVQQRSLHASITADVDQGGAQDSRTGSYVRIIRCR
jgi:hypothetical protein